MERMFNVMIRMRIPNGIVRRSKKWYFRWKKGFLLPRLDQRYDKGLRLSIPENWRMRVSAAVRVSNARLAGMIGADVSRYGYIVEDAKIER